MASVTDLTYYLRSLARTHLRRSFERYAGTIIYERKYGLISCGWFGDLSPRWIKVLG